MNKPTVELLQFILLIMSVGSALFAVVTWYSASVQKRYASQRDFEHLKRNYQQLSENHAQTSKEMDARFDQMTLDLRDIKNILNVIMVKVSVEGTGGWLKRGE